jgi:glyoxylase-like metal-dependent hydrolase (beta-lactamase superfamily II)
MSQLHTFTFNAFQEQTYLLEHGDGQATVFDPGMSSADEREQFKRHCEKLEVKIVQCLLTHAHLDHVMGVSWVFDNWGVLPRLHASDNLTWDQAPKAAELYGVPMDALPSRGLDLESGGSLIECGMHRLEVRFAPGHSLGHVIFINDKQGWVIGGDVLFKGSVGRTDLPGGDGKVLSESIENQLYTLPDSFRVWPGHGPSTTIGVEKATNPFVNAQRSGMLQLE